MTMAEFCVQFWSLFHKQHNLVFHLIDKIMIIMITNSLFNIAMLTLIVKQVATVKGERLFSLLYKRMNENETLY